MKYTVNWAIEISANNPREAAQEARDLLLNSDCEALTFEVVTDKTGEKEVIDLSIWAKQPMEVKNITDLAFYLAAVHETAESIARQIYKTTSCGCPAGIDEQGFWVTGYCEGSDREHEVYRVAFPCDSNEIDRAIEQAENDSKATWEDTHGCKDCYPEGVADRTGNLWFAPGAEGGPIDPNCPTCKGTGTIL